MRIHAKANPTEEDQKLYSTLFDNFFKFEIGTDDRIYQGKMTLNLMMKKILQETGDFITNISASLESTSDSTHPFNILKSGKQVITNIDL